ncbi:hypothetical protein DRH27_02830 [Candidatus Falkowbacteria bacterium]|nr:MAG: hypothetical protein DRH27_02830 [Candidatus Falkowbacteria bacterium]
MTEETMETNGRYFIWPDDMPMPDSKNRCYGCSTPLIVPDRQKFTVCPACAGDTKKLKHFQERFQKHVDDGKHPAYAANKVRKEIREGVIVL